MFKLFHRTTKPEDLDRKLVFSLAKPHIPKWSQLRLLPSLLRPWEQWLLRSAIAVIFAASAVFTTQFAKNHLTAIPRTGGSYREAMVGSPRLINPVLTNSDVDRDLSRLIYAGLLRYNAKGELEGDLVDAFSIEEGGRAIRFTLRPEILFHDGEALDAEDVLFTIEVIKNPAWRSPLWQGFQNISAEATDERTIVVKNNAPTPSFPHLFTVGIIPKHIWQGVDPRIADRAVWSIKPVGAGPYQFKALTKSKDGGIASYTLESFASYYRGTPYIEELSFQFFSDFESAFAALKGYSVDGISFIPERLRTRLARTDLRVFAVPFPHITGLFFQDRRSEFLKEPGVRRALALALDRSAIADILYKAVPLTTPFLQGEIGYAEDQTLPGADSAAAAKSLTDSGWKRTDEGWTKDGKRLALTVTTIDEPTHVRVAHTIAQMWESLGIGAKLEAAPKVTFEREVLRPRAYEVLLFSLLSGGDTDPYAFWHSSQIDDPGFNLSSVRIRTADAPLEAGRTATDMRARIRSYLDFADIFIKEAPGIVLYSSPYVFAVRNRVRGINVEKIILPSDRFNDIHRWYVRSRPGWR